LIRHLKAPFCSDAISVSAVPSGLIFSLHLLPGNDGVGKIIAQPSAPEARWRLAGGTATGRKPATFPRPVGALEVSGDSIPAALPQANFLRASGALGCSIIFQKTLSSGYFQPSLWDGNY